ncbi:MAG: peroxiredoxin-like family protein [Planctomycetota bacterium]
MPRTAASAILLTTGLLVGVAPGVLAQQHAEPGAEPEKAADMTTAATPVKDELDAFRAAFLQRADDDKIQTYQKGIDDVAASGVLDTALKVGDAAPDFNLPNALGESVTLSTLLAEGPVVITWYRGGWCPYCNIQLKGFQDILPELTEAGAQLVAISPETPDNSFNTKQKSDLEFHVLSDVDNAVARDFGIAYALPTEVSDAFNKGGLKLDEWNGSGNWDLPLSVTYVIDQSGTVRYAYVDPDYRNRAEPSETLDTVREITGR